MHRSNVKPWKAMQMQTRICWVFATWTVEILKLSYWIMALNFDELSFLSSCDRDAHCVTVRWIPVFFSASVLSFFEETFVSFWAFDTGSTYLCLVADFGYFDAIFNCPSISLQLWHVPSCDVAGGLYRRFGRVGGGEVESNNMALWVKRGRLWDEIMGLGQDHHTYTIR